MCWNWENLLILYHIPRSRKENSQSKTQLWGYMGETALRIWVSLKRMCYVGCGYVLHYQYVIPCLLHPIHMGPEIYRIGVDSCLYCIQWKYFALATVILENIFLSVLMIVFFLTFVQFKDTIGSWTLLPLFDRNNELWLLCVIEDGFSWYWVPERRRVATFFFSVLSQFNLLWVFSYLAYVVVIKVLCLDTL